MLLIEEIKMFNYELHQRQAERMSTGNLQRELAYRNRCLEVTGKEVDEMIASDFKDTSVWALEAKTRECRRLASVIRIIGEELALR